MFLSKTICSAIIFLTKVQFPPSFSIATILKFDRVIYTHLIITRRRVPESCDCFRQLLLLLPLTLQLDNTVATPAKHPILCRYSSIETPIPVGLLSSWSFKLVFLLVGIFIEQSIAISINYCVSLVFSLIKYSYSFIFICV